MKTYRTFKRSATCWESFSSARKITADRGLSADEARERCKAFNENRTAAQKRRGTKMEFEEE
jgi:hypothetical protein